MWKRNMRRYIFKFYEEILKIGYKVRNIYLQEGKIATTGRQGYFYPYQWNIPEIIVF